MKLTRFQELCDDYDQILINNTTPEIIANQYLHIIKAHPDSLKKYNLPRIFRIYLPLRFLAIQIIRILKSILVKKPDFNKNSSSEVLFISHILNAKQLSQDSDTYFGELPNQLTEKGFNSSIALINHIRISNHKCSNSWKKSNVKRVILSPTLGFLSEVRLFIAQMQSRKKLNNIMRRLKIDKHLAKAALIYHFSSGTFSSLRIAIEVENIIKKSNIKYIITTYEGHAWEALVYYFARRANPNIKCFGFQHSAIFENQNVIRRALSFDYSPDIILTSGVIAKNTFKKSHSKDSKVLCLGSCKNLKPIFSSGQPNYCLVIPEGIISECLILFEISLNYANEYPNQKFIWRLHPLLSFNKLKKISNIFKKIPKNILLSEDDLNDDIEKCSSVLYRGSSAVVNAINSVLKPIYFQSFCDDLFIDPIYQLKQGKFIVKNLDELSIAFEKDSDLLSKQSLQDFAQNFFMPLNIDIVLKEMAD